MKKYSVTIYSKENWKVDKNTFYVDTPEEVEALKSLVRDGYEIVVREIY